MKQTAVNLLKKVHLYHPLQRGYRSMIFYFTRLKLRVRYRALKGEGYTCNYCHAGHTRFAPWYPDKMNAAALQRNSVIAGYGENILCPYCLSTARERLVKAMCIHLINIDSKQVLHISPEKKLYEFIKEKATVVTADYAPEFYTAVDPLVRFEDATQLSFKDESFDIVIANHIMEHIPNDTVAMKEIYRVLKPKGIAVLQVPFSSSLSATVEEPDISDPAKQSALFGQRDHVRIYALDDYLHRLRQAGFEVEYKAYQSLTTFYKYAIQEEEGFIMITKPKS